MPSDRRLDRRYLCRIAKHERAGRDLAVYDRARAHHRVVPDGGPRQKDRADTDIDALSEHHPAEPGLAGVVVETCVVGDDRHVRCERDVIVDRDEPRMQAIDVYGVGDMRAHPELKTLSDQPVDVRLAPQPVHNTTPDAC